MAFLRDILTDMDFTHFLVFVMTVVIADDLFNETASTYVVKYYFK